MCIFLFFSYDCIFDCEFDAFFCIALCVLVVNAQQQKKAATSSGPTISPKGIEYWDLNWLARYMVHTHCSHTAVQPLLLAITFEFDRYSAAMGMSLKIFGVIYMHKEITLLVFADAALDISIF